MHACLDRSRIVRWREHLSFPIVKAVSTDRAVVVIVASSRETGLKCSVLEVDRNGLPGVWSMILTKLVSYSFFL